MLTCTPTIAEPFFSALPDFLMPDALPQVLVIDRNPALMLRQLRPGFLSAGFRMESAATGAAAMEKVINDPPSLILLDPQLPDQCGLELHRQIREVDPYIPVIFATMTRTADTAIEAMKQGAHDYLFKPLEAQQIERLIASAAELNPQKQIAIAGPTIAPTAEIDGALCGSCPAMREVYKSIGLVSNQDVNVLITGESGTGKELIAGAIVRHSSRAEAPFLALNCAAIPENLLESELFGHEKGAFSGADRRRVGKFEQFDGGTILLDEIGDMPLPLQAKILRLLQEQTFERVGGNETVRTNVRIIASTHRDLKAMAAAGKFRADLYYRLSVFTIHLPPLRERGDDIPMLVQHFIRKYSREMDRQVHDISQEAMDRLMKYAWPGNIRELQSVMRQALLRANGRTLLPAFLPALPDAIGSQAERDDADGSDFDIEAFLGERLHADARDVYTELHREADRHGLAQVLRFTRGNQRHAARVLGIARQTLRVKLREAGLHVTQSVESEDD